MFFSSLPIDNNAWNFNLFSTILNYIYIYTNDLLLISNIIKNIYDAYFIRLYEYIQTSYTVTVK